MNNIVWQSIQYIARDVIGSFAYYPLWWYSAGLVLTIRQFGQRTQFRARSLGLSIQLQNIFRPMYADYSIQGRIISFVMRALVLAFRLLEMAVFSFAYLAGLLIWMTLPVAAAIFLLHQIDVIDLSAIVSR